MTNLHVFITCTLNTSEYLKNSAVATGLEKLSFHSNPKERQCQRMLTCNYHAVMLISHASKVVLKILQARFQQHMNQELPDVQAGFRKGRGTRDLIANICWIIKRIPEKKLLMFYWLHQSLWLCGSWQTVESSSRAGNTTPPDLPPEKPVCRSGSNS